MIYLDIMGIIGWIFIFWSIFTWKHKKHEIFGPYIVFLISGFLFMYGQSLLLPLNLVADKNNLLNIFNQKEIFVAQVYTILSFIFFHIGALYSKSNFLVKGLQASKTLNSIRIVGIFIFIFSVVPYTYITYNDLLISIRYGYGELFRQGSNTGITAIFDNVSLYFVPSLICLYIAFNRQQFQRLIITSIFILVILVEVIIGSRGSAITLVMILLILRHYLVKNINIKTAIPYGLGAYFTLSFLSVVAKLRSIPNKSLYLYFQSFFVDNNLFSETITELGGSMFPLLQTMRLVPNNYGYRFGSSYLYSFTTVIPNIGFWDVHPGALHGNLGNWLQDVLNLNYGPGYSMAAESYINFGWFGFLFIALFGLLIGYTFSRVNKYNVHRRPEMLAFSLIILSLTLMIVRNSFVSLIRAYFYIGFPILILIYLINSVTHQESKTNKFRNHKMFK
jgi:oligosaccharide repeat unit polymerase